MEFSTAFACGDQATRDTTPIRHFASERDIIECDICGRALVIDRSWAGRWLTCPHCRGLTAAGQIASPSLADSSTVLDRANRLLQIAALQTKAMLEESAGPAPSAAVRRSAK